MMLRMLMLQNWAKTMKTQKPGEMSTVRDTCELAGRLSKVVDCHCRRMKSRKVRKTLGMLRLMQVPKAVRGREGNGCCARPMKLQKKQKTQLAFEFE